MRTVGVEEELLLVDAASGRPRSVAAEVIRAAAARGRHSPAPTSASGGSVEHEVQRHQVETDTPPEQRLDRLEEDLRAWRERVRASALEVGARLLAVGTSPLAADAKVLRTPRFDSMTERFGLTMTEQLTCGCHVHVGIESPDEGVAVLDRIRIWLPVLAAMSANSPRWHGADSGYAAYRIQVLGRWPTSGPTPVFGSTDAHRRWLDSMLDTGVLLDEAMVYADARLSAVHPTVEVRVADVCLDVRDTVLVAGLVRALVETAVREWRDGVPAPDLGVPVLRLATWQAARYGLDGGLLDPLTGRPRPAAEVVDSLLAHVEQSLRDTDDHDRVQAGVKALLDRGTGAARQRALFAEHDDPATAVTALARITAGSDD